MNNQLQLEIENLRQELYKLYKLHKTMTHPKVVELSKRLDSKISAYQLQKN